MKDAIIILGWWISENGVLSDLTIQRVQAGVALFNEWKSTNLVMSGKFSFALDQMPDRTEASAMKALAESFWVPSENIVLEEQSVDTLGNVFYVKTEIVSKRKWKSAYVVTSDFHIPRTELLFRRVFWPNYVFEFISASSWSTPEQLEMLGNREKRVIDITNRWLLGIEDGDHEAIEKVLFSVHPGYASNPEMSKEALVKMIYG